MVSELLKMIVLSNFVIKSTFGGIFCLAIFREGCSPSKRAAPG